MKINYKNKSIFFPKKDLCIVSDLHIGLEDKLIEEGISFPFQELNYLKNDLKEVIKEHEPNKLIYNGDILHKFSGIPPSVPGKLKELTELFNGEQKFIKGSHDTMLETTLKDMDYEVQRSIKIDDVLITHGDKEIKNKDLTGIELIVIGHNHPSIEIHGEKKPCFLYQKNCYKKTDILVLPAFSRLSEGVKINNLTSKEFMSPYLKKCKINKFKVIIETKDEALKFPELGKFKQKL